MSTRHLRAPDAPTSAAYCGVIPDDLSGLTSHPALASCADCLTAARATRPCYTCTATPGLASRGWSGNPSTDGVTCPDCNGTGIDRTRFGTGSDHCAHCAADWRAPHDPGCPAHPDSTATTPPRSPAP